MTFRIVSTILVVTAYAAIGCLLLASPRAAPEEPSPSPAQLETTHATVVVSSPDPAATRAAVPATVASEGRAPTTPRPGPVLPDTATAGATGKASWYCGAGSRCTAGVPVAAMAAAAGPALRVGDWRGRIVRVSSGSRAVLVKLVDWCYCGNGRVIDLYRAAFSRLASPSRGVILVRVTWAGSRSRSSTATLPPTDTR